MPNLTSDLQLSYFSICAVYLKYYLSFFLFLKGVNGEGSEVRDWWIMCQNCNKQGSNVGLVMEQNIENRKEFLKYLYDFQFKRFIFTQQAKENLEGEEKG